MGSNREDFNNKSVSKSGNKKKLRKKRRIKKTLSMISVLVIVMVIGFGIYMYSFLSGLSDNSLPGGIAPIGKEPVNILVLGMDIGDAEQAEQEVGRRTDTMMLINYNPATKKVQSVSIPRDTMIEIDGAIGEYGEYQRYWKMNAAYAIGGDEEVTNQIQDILELQINYLVKIDYNAFRNLIDAIGGVEMYIEQDMYYDDDAQNLHINFNKGETINLDGKKAEEFFRWRQNNDGTGLENGDLDRIQNQQKFMNKLMEKCLSPSIVMKIPKILNVVSNSVETNLPTNQMIKYGIQLMKLNKEDIKMTTLQGEFQDIFEQSFFIYDRDMNLELLESLQSGKVIGNTDSSAVIDAEINREEISREEISREEIKVKILNATSINGLAGGLQTELYNLGYEVVEAGNTDHKDKSIIMTENKEIREILKNDTGINKTGKLNKSEYADYDVVIILGKDYDLFGE